MKIKLTGATYDNLKKFAMVWLPALGTLYFTLAQIWHLPAGNEVVGSIVALDTALGGVLHISAKNYNASDEKYDGTFSIEPHPEGGSMLRLKSKTIDADTLASKNEVTFKIETPVSP